MKILYFSNQYGPHDYRFLSAIAEAGYKAFFLRLDKRGTQEKRPLPRGVKVVSGTIGQAIKIVKPDLVHAGPLDTCGYLAAKTDFQPLVAMSWGSDILYAAHKTQTEHCRVRAALDAADALVGDCAAVAHAAVTLGFPRKKIVIFPWGVDLKRFKPRGGDGGLRKRLAWQNDFVVLHVRGWEPLYDPETALRGFLLAAAKQSNLRLLMPGSGSLATSLSSIVKKSGLKDRVYFPGSVTQQDLPNYYRAADLYISASKSDGSSVSLMEAFASGLPVLVSDIPGNREWVRLGKEGRLFAVGDEASLAYKIVTASHDPKRLKKMAKYVRSTAVKRANWAKNKKQLKHAYQLAMEATRDE